MEGSSADGSIVIAGLDETQFPSLPLASPPRRAVVRSQRGVPGSPSGPAVPHVQGEEVRVVVEEVVVEVGDTEAQAGVVLDGSSTALMPAVSQALAGEADEAVGRVVDAHEEVRPGDQKVPRSPRCSPEGVHTPARKIRRRAESPVGDGLCSSF